MRFDAGVARFMAIEPVRLVPVMITIPPRAAGPDDG
jgi:hypothetical protein